jgi:hypothetical protein
MRSRPPTDRQKWFFLQLMRSSVYSDAERAERVEYWKNLTAAGARHFLDFTKGELDRRKRERKALAKEDALDRSPLAPLITELDDE